MAYQLKDSFGPDVVELIADMISGAYPAFPRERFLAGALDGYDDLELSARGRKITLALRRTLPDDPEHAIEILIASLPPLEQDAELKGMQVFRYLPHTYFVADYGLDCFDTSMRAQYELTQRFSAEFSIRAFLTHHPERTLAALRKWASDPSEHVRRLVSEGTRPRLPWAGRLRAFRADPSPVLELLELLKDDPSDYVRRSVANNLNDIGKDHPQIAVDICRRWMRDASPNRQRLVRHALRSLVKSGHPGALDILGVAYGAQAELSHAAIEPAIVAIGDQITISFEMRNPGTAHERYVVDYRVHFVKSNGGTTPKVFKISTVELEPGGAQWFARRLSLQQRTTRTHYPGQHRVEALVNGVAYPIGEFELVAELDAGVASTVS